MTLKSTAQIASVVGRFAYVEEPIQGKWDVHRKRVSRCCGVEITTPQSPPSHLKILRSAQQIEDFPIKKTRSSENVCSLLHVYGGYMEQDRKLYDICVCVCC